ncbi:MAG TPA: hypothetical protein PKX00_02705 [Opitutaceae bacterium]|jgi:hypothetical protein|nr:hypothetical protein [Opitutaceae bacterium]
MKLPRLLLAASLALAATGSALAGNASRAQTWLASYYQDPQPAQLPKAVHGLSREGYFEGDGQPAQAIGFFSTVFASNSGLVDYWFSQFRTLPVRHQRVLASALWYAGDPRGESMLREMSINSSPEVRDGIDRLLASNARPIVKTPVLSESSMNLQWGAFLASGREEHITNILAAVGSGQPGLHEAARISLAMNAATHSRVMEICRTQLDKQPNEVRSMLRAALNEAETQRKPGSI